MKRKFLAVLSIMMMLCSMSVVTVSASDLSASFVPNTFVGYSTSETFRIRTTRDIATIDFKTTGVSARITIVDLTTSNKIGPFTIPVKAYSTFSSSGDISRVQVGWVKGKDYTVTVEPTKLGYNKNPWSVQAWSGCYPIKLESVSISTGYYYITSRLPGSRRIEVGGGRQNNGATTNIWDSANVSHQIFKFERLSDGTYKITPKHSGKPLEVRNSSGDNGAEIAQWDWDSSYNTKRWYVINAGNGYKFVNKATGKCMDVNGGVSKNGTQVWQWEDNGTTAQRFNITRVN